MKNIKRKDLIVFGKKFKNGLRKMLIQKKEKI